MTREEMLARLHHLENHDPRRDSRHISCSVWIYERDKLLEAIADPQAESRADCLERHPLEENSLKALTHIEIAAEQVALLIAVEITEKGYTVERWAEYWAQGNLWG